MIAIDGDLRKYRKKWDVREVTDVWNMIHSVPGFVHQLQKLEAMVMCKPFKVIINNIPLEQQREMQFLTQSVWMRTMKHVLFWKFGIGIVPYFECNLEGTAHRVPHVPDITQGTLYTYQDTNRLQVFEWEWNSYFAKEMKKPVIKWIYTGNEPNLYGKLRTGAVACLEKYRMLEKARLDVLYANYHLSHPISIYEDRPPVGSRTNDTIEYSVIDLNNEGRVQADDFTRETISDKQRQYEQKARYERTKEFDEHMIRNGFLNDERSLANYGGPVLLTDDVNADFNRERFLHNRIQLPVDRHYVGYPKPAVILNVDELDKSLTRDASEIIGIPSSLTQNENAKYAPNRQGVMMITTETLKANIQWMNGALTQMYTGIYGETIRNDWDRHTKSGELRLYPPRRFRSANSEVKYEMGLASEIDIRVELQCDPNVTPSQIMAFYNTGFISKENAVDQLTAITGLPEGILEALEPPLVSEGPVPLGTGAGTEKGAETKQKRRKITVGEHQRNIVDYGKL